MLTVIAIGVSLALLLVVAMGGAMLIRAAFMEESEWESSSGWRPAFIQGDALRRWAADRTTAMLQPLLSSDRSAESTIEAVTDLGRKADRAMLPLAREAELERTVPCPARGQGVVGITPVEAIAIAARVHRDFSRSEVNHIREQSVENAAALAAQATGDAAASPLPCPLQGRHQLCCVYAVRPVRCRPLHAIAVADSMGDRRADSRGTLAPRTEGERHERVVAEGVEQGLLEALRAARLDSQVYELNSALAKALATPNAAERWAAGHDIFGQCRRLD